MATNETMLLFLGKVMWHRLRNTVCEREEFNAYE